MTKVLIAAFSQTGSTKKIADQIALELGLSNCEVTQISITENKALAFFVTSQAYLIENNSEKAQLCFNKLKETETGTNYIEELSTLNPIWK